MFNNSNSGYKPRAMTGNRSRRPVTRVSGCWEHWVPTASVQPPCWQRSWLASSVPNRCHCQSSNWKRCILLAVGCVRHCGSRVHRPLKNRRGHQVERANPGAVLRCGWPCQKPSRNYPRQEQKRSATDEGKPPPSSAPSPFHSDNELPARAPLPTSDNRSHQPECAILGRSC